MFLHSFLVDFQFICPSNSGAAELFPETEDHVILFQGSGEDDGGCVNLYLHFFGTAVRHGQAPDNSGRGNGISIAVTTDHINHLPWHEDSTWLPERQ